MIIFFTVSKEAWHETRECLYKRAQLLPISENIYTMQVYFPGISKYYNNNCTKWNLFSDANTNAKYKLCDTMSYSLVDIPSPSHSATRLGHPFTCQSRSVHWPCFVHGEASGYPAMCHLKIHPYAEFHGPRLTIPGDILEVLL